MTDTESATAAERTRLVRKFTRLRAQATLQLGGVRGLSDLEREARQQVTWLREEFKRQQQGMNSGGGLNGAAYHPAKLQVSGVQEAQRARANRFATAADLIESVVLPEIATQLQAAQASWAAADRTAAALADHLRSELEQWGIADAL